MSNRYVFNITPTPAPRMTQSDKWNERPAVMRYFVFRDELNLKANLQKFTLPNEFDILFVFKTTKTKLWQQPHMQKPDLDNLLKAFMDALSTNDATVNRVSMSKYWSDRDAIIVIT